MMRLTSIFRQGEQVMDEEEEQEMQVIVDSARGRSLAEVQDGHGIELGGGQYLVDS